MANRNRIQLSAALFTKLIGKIDTVDLADTGDRWITRESDEDAEMLTSAEAIALRLGRRLGSVTIKHSETTYLIMTGVPMMDALQLDGLTQRPSSPALFQLGVSELDLSPSADKSKIRDVIEGRSNAEAGYEGHDISEVESLFDPISYWEIDRNYIYTKDQRRIIGSAICRSGFETPLSLGPAFIEKFDTVFVSGDENVPFALLLQALLASFWQSQFVEIYRCVEQLFPSELLIKMKKELRSKRPLINLNDIANTALKWSPREDAAIRTLFEIASRAIIEEFRLAYGLRSEMEGLRGTLSTEIYRLRNSVVHFRSTSTSVNYDDARWGAINQAMLAFSDELYRRYAKSFFGP